MKIQTAMKLLSQGEMFWQGRCGFTLSVSPCFLNSRAQNNFQAVPGHVDGPPIFSPEESTAVPSWLDITRQCKIIYTTRHIMESIKDNIKYIYNSLPIMANVNTIPATLMFNRDSSQKCELRGLWLQQKKQYCHTKIK